MKVDLAFVENKINKGLVFWTVKPKSSNSTGTSYYPSGGGQVGEKDESLSDFRETINRIWELNEEPVIVHLQVSANSKRKEGPFVLLPEGWYDDEPEEEPAPAPVRGFSGVPQAQLTDAQMQKQGYVPAYLMEFELNKLRTEIEFDRRRREIDAERRAHRKKMDEEAAELAAKHAKLDAWGNKAARIAGAITEKKEIMGNLGAIAIRALSGAFGVKSEQMEALGAALFDSAEPAQPVYPPAEPVTKVEPVTNIGAVVDAQVIDDDIDDDSAELDPLTDEICETILDADLTDAERAALLTGVQQYIQHIKNGNATAPNNGQPPVV